MGVAPSTVESVIWDDFEPRIPDQSGKYVVVTGTTTGTGKVFAKTAAKKGATVIMINRESHRLEDLKSWMSSAVPEAQAEGRLIYVTGDLQNFESVKSGIAEIKSKFSKYGIDVIMNNAAVMALQDVATVDGYDIQVQTNHLSHFLITKELYPLLLTAVDQRGEAAVVNHTSIARAGGPLVAKYFGKNGGDLGGNSASMICGGARWERYHQTKLANAVFTLAMHEKLQASADPRAKKIRSVAGAPGLSRTQLQFTTAEDGGMNAHAWFLKLAQSPEDGTLPILTCAFGLNAGNGKPEVKVPSGDLMAPANRGECSGPPVKCKLDAKCRSVDAAKMLWEESEKACGPFTI